MNKLNYTGGGYAAPTLEVLDLVVEQGFAASDGFDLPINQWEDDEDDIE